MLKLPPEGHPIRAYVDITAVQAITPDNVHELPTIADAKAIARERFKHEPAKRNGAAQFGALRSLQNIIARSAKGYVVLVSIGPKGGYSLRWSFGHVETPGQTILK